MEILAPAGNLEKLKLAINYGADAVYVGLQKFGLRSAAENFNLDELQEGVEFAHSKGSKVYVVLNAYLHDSELEELILFLAEMESRAIDAVIVSDLGVVRTVKENSSIPVHLSTQASCLNVESARLWKRMGAERLVLGREVSIEEASRIKKEVEIEIELFIHGSMCMAFSGNCVISNYTQGRDSNRGGCAHSCRFKYELEIPTEDKKITESSFFMSSKDLNGLSMLPKFIEHEIDSLKIEGRMKNHLYVATVSKVYSDALRQYNENKEISNLDELESNLNKLSNREYTQASLDKPAGYNSVNRTREKAHNSHAILGKTVTNKKKSDDYIFVQTKAKALLNQRIEVLDSEGPVCFSTIDRIEDTVGNDVQQTKPNRIYKLYSTQLIGQSFQKNNVLRIGL
ncbi:MAG: peptidase U32 family protein [Bdellovibrionales bacterium]